MTAAAESRPQDEPGRTGADDENAHDSLRYTVDRIITPRVTLKSESCQVVESRRSYRSSLREEQARATRRTIVDAGAALFVERGFAGTTVDAIAERAGVSRKTVFTSVGGKVGLLKLAIDWALVGDDEPVALDDRPVVRELERETDPRRAVVLWAHLVTGIAGRLALLHPVLTAAADVDEQAAALHALAERNRLGGARAFVEQLHNLGALRGELSVERAAAMASLLMDPLGYRRLVLDDGWTVDEYAGWVARLTAASFLPSQESPGGR
jgi:AcrR family transcriptional regulator